MANLRLRRPDIQRLEPLAVGRKYIAYRRCLDWIARGRPGAVALDVAHGVVVQRPGVLVGRSNCELLCLCAGEGYTVVFAVSVLSGSSTYT